MPSDCNSVTASVRFFSETSESTTRMPWRPNSRASANPILEAAPVTLATFEARLSTTVTPSPSCFHRCVVGEPGIGGVGHLGFGPLPPARHLSVPEVEDADVLVLVDDGFV